MRLLYFDLHLALLGGGRVVGVVNDVHLQATIANASINYITYFLLALRSGKWLFLSGLSLFLNKKLICSVFEILLTLKYIFLRTQHVVNNRVI